MRRYYGKIDLLASEYLASEPNVIDNSVAYSM